MTLTEVQERARNMGIDLGNRGKSELIHTIQQKEGNSPCFGWSPNGLRCPHVNCLWRSDCLGKIGIIKSCHTFDITD